MILPSPHYQTFSFLSKAGLEIVLLVQSTILTPQHINQFSHKELCRHPLTDLRRHYSSEASQLLASRTSFSHGGMAYDACLL